MSSGPTCAAILSTWDLISHKAPRSIKQKETYLSYCIQVKLKIFYTILLFNFTKLFK